MKKNRKMTRKMSVVMVNFVNIGIIGLMFFTMLFINLVASTKCQTLERECGKLEKEEKRLNDELQREMSHWEVMKTSEGLESALKRHGLAMHYPNASQIVRVKADGSPYPGQLSLAKIAQRSNGVTANYTNPSRRRR